MRSAYATSLSLLTDAYFAKNTFLLTKMEMEKSCCNGPLRWSKRKATEPQIQLTGSPSVAQKVFAIPELLEAILLNVSLQDLLVCAPLVSKSWQATIKASRRLQQSLFFEPISWRHIHPAPRGLSKDPDRATYKLADLAEEHEDSISSPRMLTDDIFMNTFISGQIFRGLKKGTKTFLRAMERSDASWRSIFVTQPPVEIPLLGHIIVRAGTIHPLRVFPLIQMLGWNEFCFCDFSSAVAVHCFLCNSERRNMDYREWRNVQEARFTRETECRPQRRRLSFLRDKLHRTRYLAPRTYCGLLNVS